MKPLQRSLSSVLYSSPFYANVLPCKPQNLYSDDSNLLSHFNLKILPTCLEIYTPIKNLYCSLKISQTQLKGLAFPCQRLLIPLFVLWSWGPRTTFDHPPPSPMCGRGPSPRTLRDLCVWPATSFHQSPPPPSFLRCSCLHYCNALQTQPTLAIWNTISICLWHWVRGISLFCAMNSVPLCSPQSYLHTLNSQRANWCSHRSTPRCAAHPPLHRGAVSHSLSPTCVHSSTTRWPSWPLGHGSFGSFKAETGLYVLHEASASRPMWSLPP